MPGQGHSIDEVGESKAEMPHAELKYSSDLDIDAAEVLEVIETIILRHDSASGECKGRAYPSETFRHTHMLVSVSLLSKPHRDRAFSEALMADLEKSVKACLGQTCFFSLSLTYSGEFYVTNEHTP